MTEQATNIGTAPVAAANRITNLDSVRGVATLGILVMNAVSFGLVDAAYFNLDAGGSDTWLDWVVGVAGEIFVDQKTMALFSMLFGAGIVLFADRAEVKGKGPTVLSLWRNTLLLLIGLIHGLLWEGDILFVYAICSPVLLAMRKLRPKILLGAGTSLVLSSALLAVITQPFVPSDGTGLGTYWIPGGELGDAVGLFLVSDFFLRALGMMLIGVGLYRLDVMQGGRDPQFYRRLILWGLGIGLPIAAGGVWWQWSSDFSNSIAVIGEAPNTIATIPIALAYLGLITLWNQRAETALHRRVRAVGRMALTNYLMQTVFGIIVLRVLLDRGELGRTGIAVFVLAVWALQLLWSEPWLKRFRFGPFEWLWRAATYGRFSPLRR